MADGFLGLMDRIESRKCDDIFGSCDKEEGDLVEEDLYEDEDFDEDEN